MNRRELRELKEAIADLVAEAKTLAHIKAKGYEADKAERCFKEAQDRVDALLTVQGASHG